MSDYRNLNDPMARDKRNDPYDPNVPRTGGSWAWIAGAIVIIFVLAIAFGVPHGQRRLASNMTPPTSLAPPASRGLNPANPGNPVTPTNPAPPLSPMTPAPAPMPQAPTHP